MSTQEPKARDLQRAWSLLGTVEDQPTVQGWLAEAEVLGAASPAPSLTHDGKVVRRKWLAAAGVLLAIGTGAVAYMHFSVPRYETRIGEQRDVILADGSRITLNTDTALTVHYSSQRRFIELERGEALFAVKHDASQPFDVAAGGTLTRALGTEFNVDVRPSKVTVSVLEGAVRVTAPDTSLQPASNNAGSAAVATAPVTALAKGEAMEFRPQLRRMVEEKADLKRIDAWRTRRLEFSDTPLSEAVEEFNRYSKTQVTVGTPELESVRVSGVFRLGDIDGFIYSLREALRVETHEAANDVVVMRTNP